MRHCGKSSCWRRWKALTRREPVAFVAGAGLRIAHALTLYLGVTPTRQPMNDAREDVFSNVVRAGKRTYFFDVRKTRGNDLFLTITESKKQTQEDGGVSYSKHKIYLYKEDFDKFVDGLHDTLKELGRLRSELGEAVSSAEDPSPSNDGPGPHTTGDIQFEDLGKDRDRQEP